MVKYMVRPLEVNIETVSMEAFRRVGPGGHFLMDPHTIEHFRKSFWFPSVMDRTRSGTALSGQDRGMWSMLHDKAAEIRSTVSRIALPNPIKEEIRRIVKAHIPDVD